jgi:hypothetical protein
MSRRLVPVFVLLFVAVAALSLACGGGDKERASGVQLADRWLRVGEDLGTGVTVYQGTIPPQLSALLSSAAGGGADKTAGALPVHPQGKLLGSFHILRSDGTNLVWLIFDVPGSDAEVSQVIAKQLDQSPWQVVGGQQNESVLVTRFQSTLTGDIDGTAVVQPLPTGPSFPLTVSRGGNQVQLSVTRSAPAPHIDADMIEQGGSVVVRSVQDGAALDAGLKQDDRIVAVDGQPVKTLADLDKALRGLRDKGTARASLVYILQVKSAAAKDATFVLPASRSLPEGFPAPFLVLPGMTVFDVQWSTQPAGKAYQSTLLSKATSADVAQQVRQALSKAGWKLTNDQAVGFATQLDFTDAAGRTSGRARVDAFPQDQSYAAVMLQVQVGGTPSGN